MRKIYFLLLTVLLLAACGEHAEHAEHAGYSGHAGQSAVTSSYLTPNPDYHSYDTDERLDSLLYLENIVPDDTGKVWLFLNTGEEYKDLCTPDGMYTAKQYFSRALALSEQLKYRRGKYRGRMHYANTLKLERNDSTLICYQEILDMATLENDENWMATARVNIGNYYYDNWNYTKALEYQLLALPFFEQYSRPENRARIYCSIQMIYYKLEIPEKGVEYGEKALALLSDRPDDAVRGMVLMYLAQNYSLLYPRDFEKELETLNEALRIQLLHNYRFGITITYLGLIGCYYDMGAYEKSKEYAFKALEIDRELESSKGMSADMLYIAQAELALQNIRETKKWALEGYAIAKENGYLGTLWEITKILSDVSLWNRDFGGYDLYTSENDSIKKILDRENQSMIAQDLETKYETAKKELEIERQQQVIRSRDIQRRLLAAGVAGCVVLLLLLWWMLRLRSRRNAALSERNGALSEMNATKDRFFSIISHDLKNPAIALHEALRLLAKDGIRWDSETLTGYYGELLLSSESHVELILHLLDWARAQTGRTVCNPEKFFIASRLRYDIQQVRTMAAKKGVALVVDVSDDAVVDADPNIVTAVVRNLLTNAVKFTKASPDPSRSGEAGTVTLSATPVYGGDGDATDTVTGYVIAVSDTGVGMSEEQVNSLFHLDSARSQPGTAGEQGTGLGLIVCRDLLERHGCELRVESKEGVGSRFWFKLKI